MSLRRWKDIRETASPGTIERGTQDRVDARGHGSRGGAADDARRHGPKNPHISASAALTTKAGPDRSGPASFADPASLYSFVVPKSTVGAVSAPAGGW